MAGGLVDAIGRRCIGMRNADRDRVIVRNRDRNKGGRKITETRVSYATKPDVHKHNV